MRKTKITYAFCNSVGYDLSAAVCTHVARVLHIGVDFDHAQLWGPGAVTVASAHGSQPREVETCARCAV